MKNEDILLRSEQAYNQQQGPRVGDFLKMPDGLYTRFTHLWDDSIQAGGSAGGSYYLGMDGGISYSGGLDHGVKLADIRQTDEVKKGTIWFFDEGIAGASRGKHFEIDCRVFEPIEGADLSGCWTVATHRLQLEEAKLPPKKMLIINGDFNQELTNEEVLAMSYEQKKDAARNLIISSQYAHSFRDVAHQVFEAVPAPYETSDFTKENIDKIFVEVRKWYDERYRQLLFKTNDFRYNQGRAIHKAMKDLEFAGNYYFRCAHQLMGFVHEIGCWNEFDALKVNAMIRELDRLVPRYYIPNNPNNGMAKHKWTAVGDYITMKFDYLEGEEEEQKYMQFYKDHWQPMGKKVYADSIRYELEVHENQYSRKKSFSLEFIMWWD